MVEAAALSAPMTRLEALSPRILAGREALARLAQAETPSPFQSAGWIAAWLEAHGAFDAFRLVELAEASGATYLLPLELKPSFGGRVACKIGEAHASFLVPARIGSPEIPTPVALRRALVASGRLIGVDAIILPDCPARYAGEAHPFAALFSIRGPNDGSALTIERESATIIDSLLDRDARRKLRQKQAKLAALGPVRLGWAETPEAARASLGAFYDWKGRQFAASGMADPFADPAIRRFLETASHTDPPAIRHFTLEVGERLVAMLAATGGPGPLSIMITAFDPDPELARSSPGEITFAALIRQAASEGIRHVDLGAGEARYKHRFAPETVPLHDIALAVTARGSLAVASFAMTRLAKGAIKRNPSLYGLATRLRRVISAAR
jgi:CelD/BcsL family acetyltransferase involved in cellulose biosynthesis